MADPASREEPHDDEIDLRLIFAILWRQRKLIVLGTVGATLLAIGISFLIPKVYRSEGFFQLGNPLYKLTEDANKSNSNKPKPIGISIPIYKNASSQFFNPNRLYIKAGQDKSFNEEDLTKLNDDLKSTADIGKWIKPVYAFAKEDTREFAQLPKDELNAVIGLNASFEAYSPEKAAAHVSFFGNYVRDCLMHFALYNYIMDGFNDTTAATSRIENQIIETQFQLQQNSKKREDIKTILSDYPDTAKMETRQVVSVQEGGSRFLSPVTQLVGIESTLADLRRALSQLERDREKLSIRAEFFSRSFNDIEKAGGNGDSLFMLLKSIKDEVFKNKDLGRDEIKEVFNNLSVDLQGFDFTLNQNTRFISGPTVPNVHIKPRKSIIVGVTFAASLFFFVMAAFVVHWWQNNKKVITSGSF
jgi:LPS O-antigen subunit length determinant protein (WzzB/FepE family)